MKDPIMTTIIFIYPKSCKHSLMSHFVFKKRENIQILLSADLHEQIRELLHETSGTGRREPPHRTGEPQQEPRFTVGIQSERWSAFLDVSYIILYFNIVAEAGWQEEQRLLNSREDELTSGNFFGAIGIRLTL